jgi:hypothetical protein
MELVARDDPRVVVLSVALEPYAWWSATPEMLARRAVGVLDRHWLLGELPGPPSAVRLRETEPADPSDERVAALAELLRALRWKALTRVALCRQLVSALEEWCMRCRFADVELGWLLTSWGLFENGFLSEMLQQHGYNTRKWHLMPSEQESAAGPYDRWPLGRGLTGCCRRSPGSRWRAR